MSARLQVKIFDGPQLVHEADVDGPVEIGRQSDREPAPYSARRAAGCWRVVVARLDETSISRKHVRAEPLPGGRIKLRNVSTTLPVQVSEGGDLTAGAERVLVMPVVVGLGGRSVRLEPAVAEDEALQSLVEATRAPGAEELRLARPARLLPTEESVALENLLPWLRTALSVLESAAGADDFFEKAARAVVDLVGMDTGRVLLREAGGWRVQAQAQAQAQASTVGADREWRPSRQVLARLVEESRTFWLTPGHAAESLREVKSVVAAPILNRNGEVIGTLYGDRRQANSARGQSVGKLDAMLVELLAGGVAAGLARVEQEQAALRARVQFEQFFTPQLARQLAANPDLLQGRDADVTLLFCDIRGFSRISGHLGPRKTIAWVGNVMEELSECVLQEQGVLVNYIGDELLAMWGAPEEQPDHARLACRAGLAMLGRLPALNARWQAELGELIGLGIGLNSGIAQVGNTGSSRKPQYGPLGHTVNLASRVQGATRYLKAPLVITEATRQRLDETFTVRRLCRVRAVNIAEPVTLFELTSAEHANWPRLQAGYESALAEFERGESHRAAASLGQLLAAFPDDGPSVALLARAAGAMTREGQGFDPVWELPGK